MKVIFNQARKLGYGKDAKLYMKGKIAQDVPDALKADWFFKALVKVGEVTVVVMPDAQAPAAKVAGK